MQRGDTRAAQERLARNNREVAVESRALTTTDGAGGDFVPPLWMINEYVELARTARPTADRVRNEVLPTGTDQVNVPKIATGTAVAEQATQNTAVQNTDATTSSVAANVATLAGQQVVALQLIEQSPINLDTILLADLAADYAAKVDLFVLNNNATNKKGLLQESGTNASPTRPARRPWRCSTPSWPTRSSRSRATASCRPTRSSCTRVGGRT
jgi:HK97 family phage major capsid protein